MHCLFLPFVNWARHKSTLNDVIKRSTCCLFYSFKWKHKIHTHILCWVGGETFSLFSSFCPWDRGEYVNKILISLSPNWYYSTWLITREWARGWACSHMSFVRGADRSNERFIKLEGNFPFILIVSFGNSIYRGEGGEEEEFNCVIQ